MDCACVRAAFDRQVRRSAQADGSGARVEAIDNVVRWVAVDGHGWSGIRRLVAAGFEPGDEQALMVADVADVRRDVLLPDGVGLMPVTDDAGVGLLIEVHERVFGTDHTQLRRSLLRQLRQTPEMTAMVVAMAGDQPVCSARIEFLPGRQFASLWGGGTLPSWRGQGIYRALVAYRAKLAAARDYRYLQVDASANSHPILKRLGFIPLGRTTPYLWLPPTTA